VGDTVEGRECLPIAVPESPDQFRHHTV
jgi:hypothetical protein